MGLVFFAGAALDGAPKVASSGNHDIYDAGDVPHIVQSIAGAVEAASSCADAAGVPPEPVRRKWRKAFVLFVFVFPVFLQKKAAAKGGGVREIEKHGKAEKNVGNEKCKRSYDSATNLTVPLSSIERPP